MCLDHHDAERQIAQVMLSFELPIHGEERVGVRGGAAEEFAIRHTRPPESLDRQDVVHDDDIPTTPYRPRTLSALSCCCSQ